MSSGTRPKANKKGSFKGDIDTDMEVDVDIDWYFGCLKGVQGPKIESRQQMTTGVTRGRGYFGSQQWDLSRTCWVAVQELQVIKRP